MLKANHSVGDGVEGLQDWIGMEWDGIGSEDGTKKRGKWRTVFVGPDAIGSMGTKSTSCTFYICGSS